MKSIKNHLFVYFAIIVLSALLIFPACNDLLDTSPVSSIGATDFWNSPEEAIGGLNGMYVEFRNFERGYHLLGSARSEEMSDGVQNPGQKANLFENTISATNAFIDWRYIYRTIGAANQIIKNVPDIDFPNPSEKNNLLAQAYSMRAYNYFVLVKTWGEVPIFTDPTEGYDPETTFKERAPVSDIFDLITSDIESALDLFPDNDFPSGRNMWSKPATNVLKGDVFLWKGKVLGGGQTDLTTALNALENAASSNVSLLDDFSDIFQYDNKGNEEIILAMHFRENEASNHYNRMYALTAEIERASEATRELMLPGASNWWAPSDHLINQFSDDDIRKDVSFHEIFVGNTTERLTKAAIKFKGVVSEGSRRFVDDIIVYRYADLLLLIAEAKNALGQDPSSEINLIRERAYGENFNDYIFVSGSPEENDEAILQERLFELAFEGGRWWDLIRFGKAFEKVPSLQGRESEEHLLLWPITENTLIRNSRLSQTPGY